MAWTGVDAISVARNIIGPTNGREAAPGTIRGDWAMDIGHNIIHGSDGEDTACLLYTSPSPRDATLSRMPSSA